MVFLIDQINGKLNFVEHKNAEGKHPRNFAISPSGKFLLMANQFSNNIVIFKRDLKSGRLTKLTNEIIANSPSSIQMKNY